MIKFLPRRAICAGLVVMGLSASAMAATPLGSGLGQAWPNAQDVSASTHWHVYVFANNGVRYFQVNDLYGNVRAALAAANGQFLVLPMGRDAQRISTPQQRASTATTAVPLSAYAETVYRDGNIQLLAVPMSDGTTMFTASPVTSSQAAPCSDPVECSSHVQPASSSQALSPCNDPVECSSHVQMIAPATSNQSASPCDDPVECSSHVQAATSNQAASPCDDPVECSSHVQAATSNQAASPCDDPVECSSHVQLAAPSAPTQSAPKPCDDPVECSSHGQ